MMKLFPVQGENALMEKMNGIFNVLVLVKVQLIILLCKYYLLVTVVDESKMRTRTLLNFSV